VANHTENTDRIIYKKLIRDRIPEIIQAVGKKPYYRMIEGDALNESIARKIIEETFELYRELTEQNKENVLKESADLVEIILAALKPFDFGLNDIICKMNDRASERGKFNNNFFLDQVGGNELCNADIQLSPSIVFNPSRKHSLLNILKGELERSREIWIASAFYSPGATNLLLSEFSKFIDKGGKIKILLSTMGNFVKPEYFSHIEDHIHGINLKIFHPPTIPFDKNPPNFHVKAWLFHHNDSEGSIVTGSSNFTEAGLNRNIEWNYFSPLEVNLPFNPEGSPFISAKNEFKRLWDNDATSMSDEFLAGYQKRFDLLKPLQSPHEVFEEVDGWGSLPDQITPNEAQKKALDKLSELRINGAKKAAVIAATGVGKTYLAAFDFKQSKCKSLLFIAHRETILTSAMKTFRSVLNDPSFGAIHGSGQVAPGASKAVFAMIQTLSRDNHLEEFSNKKFDYIVIDEFHHAEASSYKKVLEQLSPDFLLGLTATPERMDGRDVLAYCDYNVAYEIRIMEAINRNLLTPFQYFAIYDEINYDQITWRGTKYDEEELNKALENDTRTEIIANNLKKYLPSDGKIRAIAFCSSISHARFTAERLTDPHGLPAIALWGESSDDERRDTIARLENETDPLNIICTVDIFNEGVDIPQLTHVLFLRPTQSFTIFLQQLGRGLRLCDNKDFLVVLDFVGNFRKAHVAPLALCGYTSLEGFIPESKTHLTKLLTEKLPEGCYVSPDIDVQRIWDHEIKSILERGLSAEERLKLIYQDIKNDLGRKTPLDLMDMVFNTYDIDPYLYLRPRPFGNWLRAKNYCEDGNLQEEEKSLIDTQGESFLQHIETGLNPVKSYKMVVLLSLLELEGTQWDVADISSLFKQYYVKHTDHLFDYDAMARSDEPGNYPLSSVISHLKNMPLDKMSNMDSDCFILDRENNTFRLKPEYEIFWKDPFYKTLVKDRVCFTLARYFRRARLHQTIYFHQEILEIGFTIERRFAETFFEDKPMQSGEKRTVKLQVENSKHNVTISKPDTENIYKLSYSPSTELISTLKNALDPMPEKGEKAFKIIAEKKYLKIEIPKNNVDLRGIMVDIPYNKKDDTGYTLGFRQIFAGAPQNSRWEKIFETSGYEGTIDIEILNGDHFRAWTGSKFRDKSRFPARIKAAATALKTEGFTGEFQISAEGNRVKIVKK